MFRNIRLYALTLSLVSLALVIGIAYFSWSLIVMSPQYPFFSSTGEGLNEGTWLLSRLRPYYVSIFRSKGGAYLLVSYKDRLGVARFSKVFLGGDRNGTRITYAPIITSENVIYPKSSEEYKNYLTFGSQFEVAFLYRVDNITSFDISVCEISKQPCEVARLVSEDPSSSYDLYSKKSVPFYQSVPALFINLNIDSEL